MWPLEHEAAAPALPTDSQEGERQCSDYFVPFPFSFNLEIQPGMVFFCQGGPFPHITLSARNPTHAPKSVSPS